MTIATDCAGRVAGATGSGKGSAMWSLLDAGDGAERQIVVRVDRGGILIGERELRYQLERKDSHPLAQEDGLLDVLAEMKERGLIEAEMCFRLTPLGRAVLAGPGASGRAGS
jgi:hypothetical protein